jgi:hypothetical protein
VQARQPLTLIGMPPPNFALCLVLVPRYAHVALQLRSNFGLAHFQAAVCYERLGMLAEALQSSEKALEMSW